MHPTVGNLFRASMTTALLALLSFLPASAQITDVSEDQYRPMPGAGHDYIKLLNETVNPATGSVSVRIQVPVPPGKGVTIPFSFGYDSNQGRHLAFGGNWGTDLEYLSRGGWTYLVPRLTAVHNVYVVPPQPPSDNGSVCHYFTNYVFTDLAGGSHGLPLSIVEPLNDVDCFSQNQYSDTNYLLGGDAQVQAISGSYPGGVTTAPVMVADMDGTIYHFPAVTNFSAANVAATVPDWIEDRNGNKVTFSANLVNSAFTMVDTVGRTEISTSSFGNTGDTVTVSGTTGPFTLTWSNYSPNYLLNSQYTALSQGGCGINYPFSTYPEITKLSLPNGTSFQFYYDSASYPANTQSGAGYYTGLLSKIVYPSGGYVRYVWGTNSMSESALGPSTTLPPPAICQMQYDSLAVQQRYVSFDGVHEVLEQQFTFSTSWNEGSKTEPAGPTAKSTQVVTTDLVRGATTYTTYTYGFWGLHNMPNTNWETGSGVEPLETQVQTCNDSACNSPVETVAKTYYDPLLPPAVETTTLYGGVQPQTRATTRNYSSLSRGTWGSQANTWSCRSVPTTCLSVVTDVFDDDYAAGMNPGGTLKQQHYDYASLSAGPLFGPLFGDSALATILDRPTDSIVYSGGGTKMAEADYTYDGAAVSAVSSLTGHDETNYSATYNVRGNLTTKTNKCLQTGCSNAITTFTYDEAGQRLTKTDPCGNGTCSDMNGTAHTTTYSYSNSYTVLSGGANVPYSPSGNTDAYLTQITNPLGQIQSFTYDYNAGELTKSVDENTQASTYIYNDAFARPTQLNYPDGGQLQRVYNDTAPSPSVTTCQLINGTAGTACSSTSPPTGWKTTLDVMDGVGHIVQNQLPSDPDGTTYIVTDYDGLGHEYTVTNPYRQTTDLTYGVTTKLYDALGRICLVVPPDFASTAPTSCPLAAPLGSTFTSYTGNLTTVTDQVGNQHTSETDGLGRLEEAWEAPNNSNYNFTTTYQYDPLGDLTEVTQNGNNSANARIRTFAYDSLARLTSATNPESGTITYGYDVNSNLSSKAAPKPNQAGTARTTTSYFYDALNRLTKKTYSNPYATADLYGYDGTTLTGCPGPVVPSITNATYRVGHRSAMCTGASSSAWSYDPMGRPVVEARSNKGSAAKTYNVSYQYYLDGSLEQLTYPSGDVLTYVPGGAGRPLGVSDSSNTYVASNGAFRATYWPHGALASMYNGYTSSFNGLLTSDAYNDRLQPILLSAGISGGNLLFQLCYDFHLGLAINTNPCPSVSGYSTGDNGNLWTVTNVLDGTRSAAYVYDPLNRIAQAYTVNIGANCWGETYATAATAPGVLPPPSTSGIDPWGNLTSRSGVSGMGSCNTEPLSATATISNQLSGIGMTYDAAGNVTNDGKGNTPTYDDENRIATVAGYTYSYDAAGMRMEKSNGSSGTMYWPGPGGKVLSETSLTGTIDEEYIYFNGERIARVDRLSGTVHYYFSNHLGSHTMVTSATGNCEQDIDYYPYGGVENDYCPNVAQNYKFTGKERDTESGLDNFGARYDASSMGRFMSPDPLGGHNEDPQTLNRYAYVRNNPLSLTDPTGLDFYLKCQSSDNSGCTQVQIDPNNAKSQTWVQADSNGNATIVTSDSIRAGQNTATVDENGVQINGNNQGVYFDNPASHNNPIDVAGSGKLQDFNFHIDSNCGGTCWTAGNWSFMGRSYSGISDLLDRRGAFTIFGEDAVAFLGYGAHAFSTQHRFGGPLNSPHLSVPYDQPGMVPIDPLANVPRTGGFHVDPHSDTLGHAEDVHRGAVPE
jgi:RHS repeat-associated protein